jgi:hypothetical protein
LTFSLDNSNRQAIQTYFTMSILLFMVSFLLLPTAKMVNNVYYILTALPALLLIVFMRGRTLSITPSTLGWALLLGWFVFVGTLEGDLQFLKHVLYVALFLVVISQFVDPHFFTAPLFSRLLFWSVALYVLSSSVFYWLTGHYAFGERVLWLPARMTGPIYTSMWITSCFALALPTWFSQRRFVELGIGFLIAIFLMGFALQSRSGLAALVVLVAACSILQAIANKKAGLLTFALFVFGIGILWFLTKDVPQIGQLLARGDALRFEIWSTLIGEWNECGVWRGCGLAHQSQHILTGGGGILHPHNIFLALGVYTGLVSLLIFAVLMCLALYQAWRQRNPWGLYLFASLVGLNFDGSMLIGNPDELWLLVLLPAALIIHRHNHPSGRQFS